MNYYTKRVSLAAIYKSSELHLLNDSSPDHDETWRFLERRVNGVKDLGDIARQVCTGGWNVLA